MSVFDFLYGAVVFAGFPVWLVKLAADPRWRHRLADRLACFPDMAKAPGPRLWLHAASVGEVRSVRPLADKLLAARPDLALVVTTQTATGWEEARRLYPQARVLKFPLDFSWTMGRAIERLRPSAVVLVESEFWPNLTRIAAKRGIPVTVVNGSISDRSFTRFTRFWRLASPVFRRFSMVFAQTALDRERFIRLGAFSTRVAASGNLKFDLDCATEKSPLTESLARWRGESPLWVAGSTHEGEEAAVLAAFAGLAKGHPGLKLVLAPRHPERFERAAALLHDSGIPFVRRSSFSLSPSPPLPVSSQVFLLDSVGELFACYGAASVAFVGGSLAPVGGHNMLEPAAWGVPCVWGPHVHQFRELAGDLAIAGGGREAADAAELERILEGWLANEPARRATGEKARAFVESQRGAAARTARAILALI